MSRSPTFYVKHQGTQENNNPHGYSTEPAFFVPGSKAASVQSRRKKKILSPLAQVPSGNHNPETSYRDIEQVPYGLLTPQTPFNQLSQPHTSSGQGFEVFPVPAPFPFQSYPQIDNGLLYSSKSDEPALGANILFTAPDRPSYYAPVPQANTFPHYNHHWYDYENMHQPSVDADYMDQDAMDVIRRDLSPMMVDHHMDAQPPDPLFVDEKIGAVSEPKMRKKYTSKLETISFVHKTLHEASLTPTTMLISLLESAVEDSHGDSAHALPGKAFYRSTNTDNIRRLLDLIMDNPKGAEILTDWMRPHAINLVCTDIHREMEAAKPHLYMTTAETTPEFIESWDINEIMDPVSEKITPTWSTVLEAATESKINLVKASESDKYLRGRRTTRNILSAQVHYRRSCNSAKIQIGLGLMAWSTGASRSLMDVLHKAGLSTSYCSINNIILGLHKYSIEKAQQISRGPHAFCYDNVNLSTSIFVEQRPGAMSKVQSGTFPVIYELEGVDPEHLKLEPIIENLKKSKPLTMADLRPTREGARKYTHQTSINIAQILFKHYPTQFATVSNDTALKHEPRRPLPEGKKTRFYPLSVSTIEEASVNGNLHVHDNVYIEQLKHEADSETLNSRAIPSINDQLTNARIRGAQSQRAKDVVAWERRDIFNLGFGTFHMIMNYIWLILQTHRGTIAEHGSLSHYFSLLEKARLGADRPDYHTLLATLTQILEGLILNAWRMECGHADIEAFAASEPTAADILRIAREIITKHATPHDNMTPTELPSKKRKDTEEETSDAPPTAPKADNVHANTILLIRDLLYVTELVSAVSTGDFGRVEDVLPQIACQFRGGGSNNYSMEILHFLFNLKEVWTPEFANIMRDIMLVNPSGLDGHSMAIDMNIEHLIGYLKSLFSAKGLYSNWTRLGSISAAINYLQLIKKRVTTSLEAGYRGSTHKTPDTSVLVKRVAERACQLKLQEHCEDRVDQSKPVPDLHRVGYRKFETASLAMFNKKIANYKAGQGHDLETDEVDELPQPMFCDATAENEAPGMLFDPQMESD